MILKEKEGRWETNETPPYLQAVKLLLNISVYTLMSIGYAILNG